MIFETNAFLDGEFYSLGFNWAGASADDKRDVLYKVNIQCKTDVVTLLGNGKKSQ